MTNNINHHPSTTANTTERPLLPSNTLHQTLSIDKESPNENDIRQDDASPFPNKVVTLILSHITRKGTLYECTLITKQFHVVANTLLWQVLDFEHTYLDAKRFLASLADTSPQRLETLGKLVRHLGVHGPHWTDDQLTRLLPYLSHLTHLSISPTAPITDTSFQHIQYCPLLVSLTLAQSCFSLASFSALAHHGRLRALECTILGDQEWLALLAPCPLERLKINCDVLNDNAKAAIQSFDLTHLDLHFPAVDQLFLPSCWPGLTHLTLSPCHHLDDTIFLAFFQSHPHLTHLDLKHPARITATTLDATIGLLQLTSLTLLGNPNLTGNDVRQWIQYSPSLTHVDLYFCNQISDIDFPETYHFDSNCIHLDKLTIDKIKANLK